MSGSVCDSRCRKCRYYGMSASTCDYILITCKPRGCPAGKDCIRFEEGSRKDENHKIQERIVKDKQARSYLFLTSSKGKGGRPPISKKEHKARMDLYKQHMSDRAIANELGLSPSTILEWRKKHNLPPAIKPKKENAT